MKRPKPSVIYSDDVDVRGGLLLSGELPVTDDLATLRGLALRWRGVEAELRPHHREREREGDA